MKLEVPIDLPSKWGEGIHGRLVLEGERIRFWSSPYHESLRLTTEDVSRIADTARAVAEHMAKSGADREFPIPLDLYPELPKDLDESSGIERDVAWVTIHVSFGEVSVCLLVDDEQRFATMTPEEFEHFVRPFAAAENTLFWTAQGVSLDLATAQRFHSGFGFHDARFRGVIFPDEGDPVLRFEAYVDEAPRYRAPVAVTLVGLTDLRVVQPRDWISDLKIEPHENGTLLTETRFVWTDSETGLPMIEAIASRLDVTLADE